MNGSKKALLINLIGGTVKFFHNYKADYKFEPEELEKWTAEAATAGKDLTTLMLVDPDLEEPPQGQNLKEEK